MSSKLTPFDNRIFGDAAIATIATTSFTHYLIGGSWLVGLGMGLLYAVPALILIAVLAAFVASPPTYARATLLWALFAAVVGEVTRGIVYAPDHAMVMAGTIFVVGAARSMVVLRRHPALRAPAAPAAALAEAPDVPAPAAPAPPALAPLTPALPPVAADLSTEVLAIARDAERDYRDLCDALTDPSLGQSAGVDPTGMRAAAEELLRDIRRRAPLVDRVRRIGAERGDPDTRQAGDDALAALRRQADALRAATAAALQIAAAERVDGDLLRDHTENLLMLRDAREEVPGA